MCFASLVLLKTLCHDRKYIRLSALGLVALGINDSRVVIEIIGPACLMSDLDRSRQACRDAFIEFLFEQDLDHYLRSLF